jgi:simple sugar transport system substrate-binding protein
MNKKASIKTIYAVLLTAIVVGAIAVAAGWYVGSQGEKADLPGADIRIDFFGCWSGSDEINGVLLGGLHAAADPLGITVVEHFDEGDPVVQVTQVEEALAAGTDGILIAAMYGDAMKDVLERAMAQGIPVVSVVFETEGLPYDVYVGPGSLVDYGYLRASKVDPYVPNGGKVLHVTGNVGTSQHLQNLEGYEKWFDEQGKSVTIVPLEGGWGLDGAQAAVAAELAANTDYDAIVVDTAVGFAGAYLAAKDNPDYGPGDAPIAGISLGDAVVEGIQNGYVLGTTCWGPWQNMYMAVQQIYPAIKYGEIVPACPLNTAMGWCDKNNLDSYLELEDTVGC